MTNAIVSLRGHALVASIACLATGCGSFVFLDGVVATYAHGFTAPIRHLFGFITQFGQSWGYLAFSAGAFALFLRFPDPWRRWAWQAAFVFANVAVSGLIVDGVKMIFGRARPKLLFADGLSGFTWFRLSPDYWSFPSGHVATVSALALSLTFMWPRWWLLWWIPALIIIASRIIVGAHYPNDLVGAFYLALLSFWAIRGLFDHYQVGIAL